MPVWECVHSSAGAHRNQDVADALRQLLQAVVPDLAWVWEPNSVELLASDPSLWPQEVFLMHVFHWENERARTYPFVQEKTSHEYANVDLLQDGSSLLPLEEGSPEIEVNTLCSQPGRPFVSVKDCEATGPAGS